MLYTLYTWIASHTIRKVKFLFKNSISQVFHQNSFLTIFLVKSKLPIAKKSETTTFSRVFHPPKKSTIFSWNQSWIFWTKNEDFEQCASLHQNYENQLCLLIYFSLYVYDHAFRLKFFNLVYTIFSMNYCEFMSEKNLVVLFFSFLPFLQILVRKKVAISCGKELEEQDRKSFSLQVTFL